MSVQRVSVVKVVITCLAAQAFANVLKRMLEASGRGMWKADGVTLQKLRDMYEDMDAQLEGVR